MNILLTIITLIVVILGILLLIRLRYDRLIKQIWRSLEQNPSPQQIFTIDAIGNLPEPVQRYFFHAIAVGTPLANSVHLEMSGSFRGQPKAKWLPMEASEIVALTPGFIWQAKIGKALTRFSGADYFHNGQVRMRFNLGGLIPIVDAGNENITRSGIGRLAGEFALWLPSALLPQNGVTWRAIAENTIQANLRIHGEPISLTLNIDSEGKPLKISFLRWGNSTQAGNWQNIPFGGTILAEKSFAGYTIPSQVIAGWWYGTPTYFEFFRTSIRQAQFV